MVEEERGWMRWEHCEALRRMFSMVRIHRLLLRWRLACTWVALSQQQVREREERKAQRLQLYRSNQAAERAEQTSLRRLGCVLEALLCHTRLGALTCCYHSWRLAVVSLHARAQLEVGWGSLEEAHWREAVLVGRLDGVGEELVATKKMVQRPTQLERELSGARQVIALHRPCVFVNVLSSCLACSRAFLDPFLPRSLPTRFCSISTSFSPTHLSSSLDAAYLLSCVPS